MAEDDYTRFAQEYGWSEEIARLYRKIVKDELNDEDWVEIEGEENQFSLAAFVLAWRINSESTFTENNSRRTITTLVSREETTADFPLRQYLRELIQNAIDARIQNQKLLIKFNLTKEEMTFEHNGRPFNGPRRRSRTGEMGALFEIGQTTKRGNFESTGQFGIGFKGWMIFLAT